MEEQQTNQQPEPTIPAAVAPPPVVQPPVAPLPVKRPLPVWLIGVVVILLGIFVLLSITKSQEGSGGQTQEPTGTLLSPTTGSLRTASALATQSAFIALDSAVASLSSGIRSYNAADPGLSPPVLYLPLGFTP